MSGVSVPTKSTAEFTRGVIFKPLDATDILPRITSDSFPCTEGNFPELSKEIAFGKNPGKVAFREIADKG